MQPLWAILETRPLKHWAELDKQCSGNANCQQDFDAWGCVCLCKMGIRTSHLSLGGCVGLDSRTHYPPLLVLVPLSPEEVRRGIGSNLLGQLLLGGLLLLLHDLGDGGWGLLSLPLLELADLVAVVSMVRVIGVQKVELGVVDLVLSYPSFKFRSIPRRRKKDLTLKLAPAETHSTPLLARPIKLAHLSVQQRSSSRPL